MKNKQTVLTGIAIGGGMAVILILVFLMGINIGSKKAGLFPFWERREIYPNGFIPQKFGHGVVGTIDSIGDKTFIVKGRGGVLKTILIDGGTVLRRDGSAIKFSDLKKDEEVIVIGEPQEQEGAIKARVVRIMTGFPPKEGSRSSTSDMFPRAR